ncbi:MAG: cupin domain-containing protein [Thermoplasmata archaeon]|jgi:quercetin dioxygenase-like cupin family protein
MTLWDERPEAWHEILPGVKRRILAHGDGVMLVLYEIAPNTTFPMHTHPHVQAGTFLEGGGRFRVGPETYPMRTGSAYSIPGGVPHELLTDPGGPSRVLDVFVPEREDFVAETVPPDQK